MKISEVLESAKGMIEPENTLSKIDKDLLEYHLGAVRKVYEGLNRFPHADYHTNLGIIESDYHFQVELYSKGHEIYDSRYLACTADQTHVDEMDVFLFGGNFDAGAGRLLTPDQDVPLDYSLTAQRLAFVTDFILSACADKRFQVVERWSILGLPQ